MAKAPRDVEVRLSLPLPQALHERLQRVARADRRTMKDFAILAIERAVADFEEAEASRKK